MFGLMASVFTNKLPNYKFEFSEFKLSASEPVRRLKDEVSARPMVNERSELVGLALTG